MSEQQTTLARPIYGEGDASFHAAGGEEGIRRLVHDFYEIMSSLPEANTIHVMHEAPQSVNEDKLARFLCGWLGGPKLYREKYGSIRIPTAHQHLVIGIPERDAWLKCMELALERQPFKEDFKRYLLKALFRPAETSRISARGKSS